MPALTSTGAELRRFRHGLLPRIAIVALILIPLLYGALYLWAFWDPTGRMTQLPVALVNADRSTTTQDGTTVDAGTQVVDALLDDGSLDWVTDDRRRRAAPASRTARTTSPSPSPATSPRPSRPRAARTRIRPGST